MVSLQINGKIDQRLRVLLDYHNNSINICSLLYFSLRRAVVVHSQLVFLVRSVDGVGRMAALHIGQTHCNKRTVGPVYAIYRIPAEVYEIMANMERLFGIQSLDLNSASQK